LLKPAALAADCAFHFLGSVVVLDMARVVQLVTVVKREEVDHGIKMQCSGWSKVRWLGTPGPRQLPL
jgi:hypothetical protein